MKIIFLTGHRKSGTTLLHSLFDGHPQLNVIPTDLTILYDYFPMAKECPEDQLLPRLEAAVRKSVVGFAEDEGAAASQKPSPDGLIGIVKRNSEFTNLRDKQGVLKMVIDSWAEHLRFEDDVPLVVKETSQAIYFHDYINWFSDIQFINIIRDPRDNYAAIKSGIETYYSSFGEADWKPLASLINRARMDLLSAKLNNASNPEAFEVLRFEDLVSNPESEMRRAFSFCGIEYSELGLSPTKAGTAYAGNNFEAVKFTGVSSGHVGRWKDRITKEEAEIIEFWLHDVMGQWGYELSTELSRSTGAFSRFYDWYNNNYFYHDSLANAE